MDALLVMLSIFYFPVSLGQENASLANSTNDMYVIHATVYQVGIITNKSDEEIANMTGNQESLSFYHSNGTAVDLSAIPTPLMTNVTAQSVVGVAPAPDLVASDISPWPAHDQVSQKKNTSVKKSENSLPSVKGMVLDLPYLTLFRRSLNGNLSDFGSAIKVVKETALIPPGAGLQSVGLPSLLGLNSSLAAVPVPIPNTSIVRYAKINTLVRSP